MDPNFSISHFCFGCDNHSDDDIVTRVVSQNNRRYAKVCTIHLLPMTRTSTTTTTTTKTAKHFSIESEERIVSRRYNNNTARRRRPSVSVRSGRRLTSEWREIGLVRRRECIRGSGRAHMRESWSAGRQERDFCFVTGRWEVARESYTSCCIGGRNSLVNGGEWEWGKISFDWYGEMKFKHQGMLGEKRCIN